MIANPVLNDPRTVLHALNFKAAFVCLAALFMPDCPRPVGREWLCLRTGINSPATIGASLKHLANLGVVTKTASGWYLTDGAKQLPLPFAQLEPRSQAAPHIIEADPGSILDGGRSSSQLTAENRPRSIAAGNGSSSQLTAPPRSQGEHQPRAQAAIASGSQLAQPSGSQLTGKSYPQAVDNSPPGASPAASGESKMNGRFPEVRSLCTADHDHDDDVNSYSYQPTNHHSSSIQRPFKMNATATELFLAQIGMDDPMPARYADADLPLTLAYWWYAKGQKMHTPHGFLYRRLQNGHADAGQRGPAVPGLLTLARVWPGMDAEDRRELRDAAGGTQNGVYHPPVANGRQLRYQLGEDFYPELDAAALDAYLYLVKNAPEEVET